MIAESKELLVVAVYPGFDDFASGKGKRSF